MQDGFFTIDAWPFAFLHACGGTVVLCLTLLKLKIDLKDLQQTQTRTAQFLDGGFTAGPKERKYPWVHRQVGPL
jgi:hypothetical protein